MKTTKIPKMSFVCDNCKMRPAMGHVLVTKKEVVATDGHCLVMHPVEEIFSSEFIAAIPERILIHRNNWRLMEKPNYAIEFIGNQIKVMHDGYFNIIPHSLENESIKYPEWESIFDRKEIEVKNIGINPSIVHQVSQAMFRPYDLKLMKLNFRGTEDGIVITTEANSSKAIIMPIMVQF